MICVLLNVKRYQINGGNKMLKFIGLFANLGVVAFVLAAAGTIANYLFGTNIGFKGAALPNDPVIAIVFLVMAGVFGIGAFFVNKKLGPVE